MYILIAENCKKTYFRLQKSKTFAYNILTYLTCYTHFFPQLLAKRYLALPATAARTQGLFTKIGDKVG